MERDLARALPPPARCPPPPATGITAPEEYGGMGMGYSAHCVAMEVGA